MTSTANINHHSHALIIEQLYRCYTLLDMSLCISQLLPVNKSSYIRTQGLFGNFVDYLKAKLFFRKRR